MIQVNRQINLIGIDDKGDSHTICSRRFRGMKSVVKSYFMTMSQIIEHDNPSDLPRVLYIVNNYSYFVFIED